MPGPWEKYSASSAAPQSGPWAKYGGGGQTHAAPVPEDDPYSGFKTAENVAKGVATAAGVGAPIAAIAGGAEALPVLGATAAGYGASLAADKLLKATGAEPWLQEKAGELRKGLPEPKMGGDWGVPLNFLANLGIEATHPRAQAASALEALPYLAQFYAASKGGELGAMAGASKPATFLKESLIGSPKVPKGQEGSALLNTLSEQFGTKPVAEAPLNTGELRQQLAAGRSQLGAEKGAVEKAAFAGARQPENAPDIVRQAIAETMKRQGVPEGKLELATSPAAAQNLAGVAENVAPKVGSIEDLSALQRQMASKGASARKPTSPVSEEAPYYESTAQNLKAAIGEHLPEGLKEPLAIANKDFSAYAELQKMGRKASRGGEFSPDRMVAEWKTMTPGDKARIFKPETIKAVDEILRQGGQGILGRLIQAGRQLSNAQAGTALKTLVTGGKPEVRFNAKRPIFNPSQSQRLGLAGAMMRGQ